MAWQQWNSGAPVIQGLSGIVNPAPVVNPTGVLPPGAQYTPEQWAQMQQQNWQQWAQWQQQYQQWHQQYGAEYQKSMTALSQAALQTAMPNTSVPPPLPPEVKPPQPPDEPTTEEKGFGASHQLNFSAPPPSFQPSNQNKNVPNQQQNQPPPVQPPPQLPANQTPSFSYNRGNNQNNRNFGNYQQNKNVQNKPPSLMSLSIKKPEFGKETEPKRMKIDNAAPENTNTKVESKVEGGTQNAAPPQTVEDMSETEKKFIKQFTEWEAQFNKWKEQNANHPDKEQYKEYEKKWEAWRSQLLERREQMRRKRLGLENQKPSVPPSSNITQPKVDNISKPTPVCTFEPPEVKDDGSSFLKLTSSDGIPGLDLVGDAPEQEQDPENETTVIELDKSPEFVKKPGPDLEAISKGINSILGDQKLLSILSMVSQKQNMPPVSTVTDTISEIHETKGLEKEPNETSSQGGWSSHGEQKNLDNSSNYDDQSRSSFGVKQDQDWGNRNYDRDCDSYSNANYSKGPGFFGRNQENYRDPENVKPSDSFKDPDSFRSTSKTSSLGRFQPPDNFRVPDNLRGQENIRNSGSLRGPDNFQRFDNVHGPDNSRGPGNFRGLGNFMGQGNFQSSDNPKAPDNFHDQNNFQGGNDSKRTANFCGPDNARSSNNFRGPGSFKPADNSARQDNFRAPNSFRKTNFEEPDNFRGSDSFHGPKNMRGGGGFRGGRDFRGPDGYRQDTKHDFHEEKDFDMQDNYEPEDNFRQDNFRENNFQGGKEFQPLRKDQGNFGSSNFQNQGFQENFAGNRSQFDDDHMEHGDEEYYDENYDNYEGDEYHDDFAGNNRNSGYDESFHDDGFDSHNYDGQYEDNLHGYEEENYNTESVPDTQEELPIESEKEVAPVEVDMWQPVKVVEYDHKSQKPEDVPVSIEPLRTFDYRHKPVNRIPLPQRPDWLKKTLRNCREFDFVISRYDQPAYSRYPLDRYERYSDNFRYPDRGGIWRKEREDLRRPEEYRTNNRRVTDDISPWGKFDETEEPQSQKNDVPQRGKFDDMQRGKYEDPHIGQREKDEQKRGLFGDRPRTKHEDPSREPYRGKHDEGARGRYEESHRGRFEEPEKGNYSDQPRGRFEEPERLRYEEPQRVRFEERYKGRFEEPERVRFEDAYRGRFEEPDRVKFEEPQRGGRFDESERGRFEESRRGRFEESPGKIFGDRPFRRDDSFSRDDNDVDKDIEQKEGDSRDIKKMKMSPVQTVSIKNVTLIEDILNTPGRFTRPARIVIILRGPPGSGKTYLAKLIKDKEVENGGSAPRILSLDDYFMVEQEKQVEEDGKRTKVKVMEYEYDESMEMVYRNSLFKAFKKTITDGYFPFIIVDNINDKVKYFGEMWSFAKQNGFQVYICQLEFDLATCTKRNIHNRSEAEIQKIIAGWEQTPTHHPILDATSLVQSASIPEVEMEEINSPPSDDFEDCAEEKAGGSKWDNFDCSIGNLAKLDGTNKPLRPSKTMEDYLQIDDEWVSRESKPGQKRVRWADLEERKEQQKMRAIGFVVGQTNWDRMMDPTMGSGALTQTKYIERVPRYYRD